MLPILIDTLVSKMPSLRASYCSADSPELKQQALIAGLVIDDSDLIKTGVGLVEGGADLKLFRFNICGT